MSNTPDDPSDDHRAATLLHHRAEGLTKGDPIALPLISSSMFHLPGEPDGANAYGRVNNPTWEAVEAALSVLEEAPCLCFPSGMAAISAALFATLKAGDTLLVPSDGYYVTRVLSDRFLARLGVTVLQRDTKTYEQGGFEGIDVVFIETPSNPGLDLCDIASITAQVRRAGGVSIVDNTTMTPFGQRPLELGADIVVASDTKAPGGHSDLLMGHVASRNADWLDEMRAWRTFSGSIPAPHAAWLLNRGLETLDVRFDRMCASAQIIAERLQGHKAISAIRYPGLQSDPSYALATRQMNRFGFLISITLPTAVKSDCFITNCDLLHSATSFGGVHSSAERRARWGDAVAEGQVRLSIGCEPVDDLWNAMDGALQATVLL